MDAPADQPKPKLFVIAVGINQYGDTFKRLSHAVADAKAFGAAMKAAGEGLYAEVDVTTVLDADATIDNLEIIDAVGARCIRATCSSSSPRRTGSPRMADST